jgi:hypothetical protein
MLPYYITLTNIFNLWFSCLGALGSPLWPYGHNSVIRVFLSNRGLVSPGTQRTSVYSFLFFIYKLYIYNLLSIFGVMSKFALSRCLESGNHPLMILLQALWQDYDDFSFFRLWVVLGQTATVSSIFLHLVGCCVLRLVCYCVRVRFDGRVLTICVFLLWQMGFADLYGEYIYISTCLTLKTLHFTHRVYLCDLHDSQNKEQLHCVSGVV